MKTTRAPDLSPLTSVQIRTLCAFANIAHKRMLAKGAIDDGVTVNDFRHHGQMTATKIGSLKEMTQEHYRTMKAHWLNLLGLIGEAYDLLIKTGNGQEQRELMQWQISGCAANLTLAFQHKGELLADAVDHAWRYILKIARDKFEARKLSELSTLEMVDLRNTIINRTNAMMGRGRPENRNKSQRARKPAPTADGSDVEEVTPGHRREAAVTNLPNPETKLLSHEERV